MNNPQSPQGSPPEGCPIMGSMRSKKPRLRRSFTAEFKAEIVDLCQRGTGPQTTSRRAST